MRILKQEVVNRTIADNKKEEEVGMTKILLCEELNLGNC